MSEHTQETRDIICDRLSGGESLTSICKDDGMPAKVTVFKWIRNDAEFANQYARAREAQAEHYLDEIIQISDNSVLDTDIDPESGNERTNHDVIQRAKLRVDTRKWAMSRLAPKKYGDRITHGGDPDAPINHQVGITVTFHDPDKAG